MAELQQETERRAADSGEAREQLQQLQQEVAELQRQQHAAGQQAQRRLTEVSPCPIPTLWNPVTPSPYSDSSMKPIAFELYPSNDAPGRSCFAEARLNL